MVQFVSRVHNKQDDKLYNLLPIGDMPTVVFGRVIRPNSIPGMQYYFQDGKVKWKNGDGGTGYSFVKPFPKDEEEKHWGTPCIFTVPENLDFNKMADVEYIKQFCKTAKNLKANTTSENFIIRDGNIICIRKLTPDTPCVVSRIRRYKKSNRKTYKETFWSYIEDDHKICNKKRIVKLISFTYMGALSGFLKEMKFRRRWSFCGLKNTITFIPIVTRCPRRKSIFHYKYRVFKNNIMAAGDRQWMKYYRIN